MGALNKIPLVIFSLRGYAVINIRNKYHMKALPAWAIIEPEEKKKEGELYIPDNAKSEMQRGKVVDIGDEYWKDGRYHKPDFKIGDRVVFKRYHDQDLEIDGKKYKIVPVEQIMVIL